MEVIESLKVNVDHKIDTFYVNIYLIQLFCLQFAPRRSKIEIVVRALINRATFKLYIFSDVAWLSAIMHGEALCNLLPIYIYDADSNNFHFLF